MPTKRTRFNPLAVWSMITVLSSNRSAPWRALVRRLTGKINAIANMMKKDEDSTEWYSGSLYIPEALNLDTGTHNPFLNNATNVSLKDVNEALLGLRSLQNDLANFSKLLDERVVSLKKERQLRIRNAVNSIPPEILSEIFQHACSSDSAGVRFAFTLSQVCKQFRVAAVHTPAIWATVTDDLPSEWVKLCLARSVSSPLTIRINDETHYKEEIQLVSSQEFSNFISLISPACNRWQSFTYFEPEGVDYILKGPQYEYMESEELAQLQLPLLRSSTSGMSFPALRVLSVTSRYEHFYPGEYGEMFFSSWVCPRLASFHGHSVLPYLPLTDTLTVCYLHIRNDHDTIDPVNDYGDFPEHLASLTSLKKLVFHLEIVEIEDELQIDYFDSEFLAMNALEELHIIHERTDFTTEGMRREGFDSGHFFKSMFTHMELPALKTLVFQFVLEGNVFRNIQEAMPVASRCPNLRRLTLKHRLFVGHFAKSQILAEYVTTGPTGFQSLFPLFPQIHHLKLEGSTLCQFSHEMPEDVSLPPLRAITVRGNTDEWFILDLISRLKGGRYWHLFETLNLEEMQKALRYTRIRKQLGVKKLVVVD